MHMTPVTRRRGFALIELLVVLAIIAILAGLLFPIFAKARAQGRQTQCLSQLRQIGLAIQMYQQDFEELPPRLSALYPGYISEARLYICLRDPQAGQHEGGPRLEGNVYLATGVSYVYVPNWPLAQEWGWWNPAPHYGPGKWEGQTPLVDCEWHWATYASIFLPNDLSTTTGRALVLYSDGSVRSRLASRYLRNMDSPP